MKKFYCLVLAVLLAGPAIGATKIKDLANIAGIRPNQLVGYGLVVGLDGTGDKNTSSPFTAQSMKNMLSELGIHPPSGSTIDQKNAAAVILTATMPPFARSGQQLDVTVSSLGDSKSLRGGTLVMSPLKGADGQIYAMAQGNVVIGGAGASSGGSRAQVNQLSSGRIPNGATVEREVPTPLGSGDFIRLELMESDFTTAERVVQAINREFGDGTARASDSRLIQVRAPYDSNDRVQFLSRMENIAVTPADVAPLVIVNARTGSIVINQGVQLEPCAVAHGSLSVTVNNAAQVSQPNALSNGQTAVTNQASISIKAEPGKVMSVPRGANLNAVVGALNSLGATPQDLVSILQAMKAAGALRAELQII
jgi:flagellar P-ring protein precursor FlgI